jgi:hypothetical protein
VEFENEATTGYKQGYWLGGGDIPAARRSTQQFFTHFAGEKCVRLHEGMCAAARIDWQKCVRLHEFRGEAIVCRCTN